MSRDEAAGAPRLRFKRMGETLFLLLKAMKARLLKRKAGDMPGGTVRGFSAHTPSHNRAHPRAPSHRVSKISTPQFVLLAQSLSHSTPSLALLSLAQAQHKRAPTTENIRAPEVEPRKHPLG